MDKDFVSCCGISSNPEGVESKGTNGLRIFKKSNQRGIWAVEKESNVKRT